MRVSIYSTLLICCLSFASQAGAEPLRYEDSFDALRNENWQEAREILEEVIEGNPYQGMAHYYLATTLMRLDECAQAIIHLDHAIAAGANAGRNGMRRAFLNRATCEAREGDDTAALASLETAWRDWGFDDFASLVEEDDFDAVASTNEFRTLAGYADNDTRDAHWRADIDYFIRLITETHPDTFHAANEAAWRAQATSLRGNVSHMSDTEIVGGLMQLASAIGDGHTVVYPVSEGDGAWHLLPIFPMHFSDGWYVFSAPEANREIVGARILRAGGLSIDDLEEQAGTYHSADNDQTGRWLSGLLFQVFEFYQLAGAADGENGRVTLTLELEDGTQLAYELAAQPIDRNPNARAAPTQWVHMGPNGPSQALWLQQPQTPFWVSELPDGVVYAQVNQIADTDEQTMGAFGQDVLDELRRQNASVLVIDLRHNNGGNANHARDFVRALASFEPLSEPGRLFVLTGPRSFSATMYLVGALEQYLEPTLVGMPTGGRPNFYSTERTFRLPYSGVEGSISARMHIDGFSADDRRPWFPPDYVVWPTGADVRDGRDPLLELVLEGLLP